MAGPSLCRLPQPWPGRLCNPPIGELSRSGKYSIAREARPHPPHPWQQSCMIVARIRAGRRSVHMRVRVGCEFDIESDGPVPMLMLVRARPDAEHTTVHESQWLEPRSLDLREYTDSFGNRCWRLTVPGGPVQVRYDAVVDVADEPDPVVPDAHLVPVEQLPDDALVFTLPSRYVQSDLLLDDAWQLFGDTPPTWARVQAVVEWVHSNVRYEAGSSMHSTTALDVFERRVGVCRDFALVSVAL